MPGFLKNVGGMGEDDEIQNIKTFYEKEKGKTANGEST